MLEILYKLEPFFRDNYARIHVREYARITDVSAPTASTTLQELCKEGLLHKEEEHNYICYFANNQDAVFIQLARLYWLQQLRKSGLLAYLEEQLANPLVVLFGSFAKAEVNKNSDIDIFVLTSSKKNLDLEAFEKKLNRKIQLFMFKKKEEVKSEQLLNNILDGFIVLGGW